MSSSENWATPLEVIDNLEGELAHAVSKRAKALSSARYYSNRILELQHTIKENQDFYKLVPDPKSLVLEMSEALEDAATAIKALEAYADKPTSELINDEVELKIRKAISKSKRLLTTP